MIGITMKVTVGTACAVGLLIAAAALPSCAPGNGNGTPGNTEPLFSDEDVQTLRSAKEVYDQALTTLTEEEARTATVTQLNDGFPNVTQASLSEDGYSIFVDFADGTQGVVYTLDQDAMLEGLDQLELTLPDGSLQSMAGKWTEVSRRALAPGVIAAKTGGGVETPSSKRVRILGTCETVVTDWICSRAYNTLTAAGWKANEIDITQRRAAGDKAVTPDDFFNLGDYGVIVLIGHGGYCSTAFNPNRYFYLQCCDNVNMSSIVGEARWAQYKEWEREHKLLLCTLKNPERTGDSEHILVRSDLLEEQMNKLPGSHVHIVSCRSWSAKHAFIAKGCGDFLGWSDKEAWVDGCGSVVALLWKMVQNRSPTDEAAHNWLLSGGMGVSAFEGCDSTLMLYTGANEFYFPAWADVTVDDSGAPTETDQIVVELSYTAATLAGDVTSAIVTGGAVTFDDILPSEAELRVIAQDAGGATLASGQETVDLHAGLNEVDLEFCSAVAEVTAQYPPTTAEIASDAEHLDPTVDWTESFSFAPGDTYTLENVLPGRIGTVSQATDADGQVVGISEQTFSLDCDTNDVEVCFGWVTVRSDELPAYTDSVTVETSFADADLSAPEAVEYGPGSSASIIGFRVGAEATFTATAKNSAGQILGDKIVVHTIVCGENDVVIDFYDYGIILETDAEHLPADGTSTATITATAKRISEGDLLVPTGDPVAGKAISLDTSVGTFTGDNPAVTDDEGVATIELSSAVEGRAAVRAFVTEDLVESDVAYVRFGEPYGMIVEADPTAVWFEPTDEGSAEVTATLRYWEDGDTDEPTGDPVSGKEIEFDTTLGTLAGTNPATTTSAGSAVITVTSSAEGTTTVIAAVSEDSVSGTATVEFNEGNPDTYSATVICITSRDLEIGYTGYAVYVEFAKLTGDESVQYHLVGEGINDTLHYYGETYDAIGPPFPEQAKCEDTGGTWRVILTRGGSCCDVDNAATVTDEELCDGPMSRFEGSVWEVTPVY